MLASMVLLTYNRFCVIVLSKYSIFSSSIVTNVGLFPSDHRYFQFLVFLCFLNFFIPTVLKLLPGCSYLFNSTTLHWGRLSPSPEKETPSSPSSRGRCHLPYPRYLRRAFPLVRGYFHHRCLLRSIRFYVHSRKSLCPSLYSSLFSMGDPPSVGRSGE